LSSGGKGLSDATSHACECCGAISKAAAPGAVIFGCTCMHEFLCARCNHCLQHCVCQAAKLDLSYPEQLAIARSEWRAMGVCV